MKMVVRAQKHTEIASALMRDLVDVGDPETFHEQARLIDVRLKHALKCWGIAYLSQRWQLDLDVRLEKMFEEGK